MTPNIVLALILRLLQFYALNTCLVKELSPKTEARTLLVLRIIIRTMYITESVMITIIILVQNATRNGANLLSKTPIFVTEIPPGHRDWRLISVAHEEGNLHSFACCFRQRCSDQGLPGREASVSGRHHHCRFALQLCPVGGNNKVFGRSQSLLPAPHERSVYGQGLNKVRRATAGGGSVTSKTANLATRRL